MGSNYSKIQELLLISENHVPEFKRLLVAYYKNRDNETQVFLQENAGGLFSLYRRTKAAAWNLPFRADGPHRTFLLQQKHAYPAGCHPSEERSAMRITPRFQ